MIPKVDLHRHFGGCITPDTVLAIQQRQPELRNLAPNLDRLSEIMTYLPGDTNYNFQRFLQKFHVLNHIRWDEASIDIAVEQVVKSLKDEGIEYTEIRFSIDKYLNHINWDETEACLFFLSRVQHWKKVYGVAVGPVLCMKYETPKRQLIRLSKVVNHWHVAEQLVGVDFVSDEAFFDSEFLQQICRFWRMCGKEILVHAGETQPSKNVRDAILKLGATRIAHAVTADPDVLSLAKDEGVIFDISLTSNLKTGVVKNMATHPVKTMLDMGCRVALGTDDPVTFGVTLEDEYKFLQEIGIGSDMVDRVRETSAFVWNAKRPR